MKDMIRNIASFVKWRIIPFRYLQSIMRYRELKGGNDVVPTSAIGKEIEQNGYVYGESISPEDLSTINASYESRIPKSRNTDSGHTFVNLFENRDLSYHNDIVKLLFSKNVLDVAMDYFGGKFSLYGIQVLYSFPSSGELRESQLWHKDYGDNRTLHCIFYLNDVPSIEYGPFVFTNKSDSQKIRSLPYIRRIADDQFNVELDGGTIIHALGSEGSSLYVDPSQCYHCGSRCEKPRLAIFLSFNTSTPFVGSSAFVKAICDQH